MRTLICGSCGYVGGYLTDYLLKKEHFVVGYDNLLFEDRYLKDVEFVYGDVRDTDKLISIVEDYDIDTVVWLAAIVGDGACNVDPTLTQEINFLSLKRFVDRVSKDVNIVFSSTCSCFGANKDLLTEESPVNPLSLYAATKLESETYLRQNHPNSLIFRLGTLFGMGDRFSRLRFDLVINILSLRAVLGQELTVFGGDQWRPLLHVKDVARAIELGIRKEQKGLYNLAWKNYKICDAAQEVVDCAGVGSIKLVDIKYEDQRDYKVDYTKYRIDSGFSPIYNLNDGINEITKLIRENRIKQPFADVYHNEKFMKGTR